MMLTLSFVRLLGQAFGSRFGLQSEWLQPLAQVGAHPRIAPRIIPSLRRAVPRLHPLKDLIVIHKKPRSARLAALWIGEQHPNRLSSVPFPFNGGAAFHLNASEISLWATDYQVFAVHVGLWSIYSISGPNKNGGRLCAVGSLDFIRFERHGRIL